MQTVGDQPKFVWGVATASHQVEGAWRADGKGLSIWDGFACIPGKILNGDTGERACDQYHRFEEDVRLMQELGVGAYRFSIAWPRIVPDGKGAVNPEGIAYYNRLIDCLQAHGIEPWVTLYHWDLPLALQLEDDGWLSRRTATAFARYAQVCFDAFGDRVTHWMTFNEPWCTAVLGHGSGCFAPGRVSSDEPYQVGHHQLLAHGLAVQAFRAGGYDGAIGIANNCDWREPLTDTPDARQAAQTSLEFFFGWFTDPVVFGDYPTIMRDRLGARLPRFSPAERDLLKGSVDFLGLNHYTTQYVSAEPPPANAVDQMTGNGGLTQDVGGYLSSDPAWETTSMGWFVVPWGLRKMLGWIQRRYPGLPLYVTENGCAVHEPDAATAASDTLRCRYLEHYTQAMRQAIQEDGTDVRGYFCWTLMDNFEWARGFSQRFGLVRCDFDTLERTPKQSFFHYRDIIHAHPVIVPPPE
ncbi:MAG: beta-glucosidase [Candidatus Marinimicrobia bacterium]|nr:beta-glucosidase [Candidatus Neomarinimicrobiota bacterium]